MINWLDELTALAPVPAVVIANLALRERWARVLNLSIAGTAAFFVGASAVYNLALAAAGSGPALPPAILLASAAIAGPLLLEPVRGRLARVLPLDPASPPTALALVAVVLLIGIQADYQAGHDALAAVSRSAQLQPLDVVGQELPLLLLALLGVGLFSRRRPAAVLERLGVVRPALWHLPAALAVAGLFVALSQGAGYLQQLLDPELANRLNQATSHYYGGINGWVGIGVIALAPGICEETFFRGALQPRLGLPLAALAFAAVHTQYALTVDTLLVFILGCGLGLLRRWLNTTSSMVAHTAYNGLAGIGLTTAWLPIAIPVEILLVGATLVLWWRSSRTADGAFKP